MSEIKRYHPALVVLHWLLAIAILGTFVMGSFVLDEMKNDVPEKVLLLKLHIVGGLGILVLTLLRLIVRMRTPKPAPVVTDSPLMDKVGTGVHHLLYLLTALAVLSGVVLALNADLFAILFKHVGNLPDDFDDFASHQVHGLLAQALVLLTLVHVAGALKHQFILKNNIFARMSLRKD